MQAEMLELSKYRMAKAKECLADAQDAFRIRNQTDYNHFHIVSKDEAQKQLENAQSFTQFIARYIDKVIL